jgi:hypothetical protein
MISLRDSVRRTDSALVYIIKRFPQYWGQIRRIADVDEKFCDLCRDYADAVDVYRYWRARGASQALDMARDYATVVAELEAEIYRQITADDSPYDPTMNEIN